MGEQQDNTQGITPPQITNLLTTHDDDAPQQHAFATELGVASLLCYALACGDRTPHKFVFHKRSGRLLSVDLRPGHGAKVGV